MLVCAPQAYHSVRGQAVIKLYVVFNVLEIFDKLCASFGQARRALPHSVRVDCADLSCSRSSIPPIAPILP